MAELKKFIIECKYNSEINKKKNLNNIIDLNYVIERLEEIEKELLKERES